MSKTLQMVFGWAVWGCVDTSITHYGLLHKTLSYSGKCGCFAGVQILSIASLLNFRYLDIVKQLLRIHTGIFNIGYELAHFIPIHLGTIVFGKDCLQSLLLVYSQSGSIQLLDKTLSIKSPLRVMPGMFCLSCAADLDCVCRRTG